MLGHDGGSGRWPDQAEQHAQGGCLPGSVRAEESKDLATPHLEVEGIDGRDGWAVSLGQLVGRNDVFTCHWLSPSETIYGIDGTAVGSRCRHLRARFLAQL